MDCEAVLYVYPGLNGLPSIDPSCCQIMLLVNYYRLTNVKFKHYKYNPTLEIPCLVFEGKKYTEVDQIIKQVEKMSENSISNSSTPQSESIQGDQSKILAYKFYISDCFRKAVYLHFFEEKLNRQHAINIMKKSLVFPMNMVFTRRLTESIESMLELHLQFQISNSSIQWDNVIESLTDFTNLLDAKLFLCGDQRSELDAYFVGCLAPVLLGKFPTSEFATVLSRFRYLTDYINRYMSNYSKNPNPDYDIRSEPLPQNSTKDEDSAPPSTVVVAVLFAGTVMIVFGMVNGIIKIR